MKLEFPTLGQVLPIGLIAVLSFSAAATITRCVETSIYNTPAPIPTWHLRPHARGQMNAPNIGEIIGAADEHLRILLLDGTTEIDCACVNFSSTPEDPRAQQHCACTAPAPTPKGPTP